MKNKNCLLPLILLFGLSAFSQVKIGNNPTSLEGNSLLELESTNKGVLFPRMALTGTTNIAPLTAHVAGMTVYNNNTVSDVVPGLYVNDGAKWVLMNNSTAISAVSVVTNTASTYSILGTEDIILSNVSGSCAMTLPISAAIGKRIVISNKTGAGGIVSMTVVAGGVFWNGNGFATATGNSNVFTYTGATTGWINESIGLN